MQDDWRLCGRDTELAQIESAFDNGASSVLLVGPAGVGKSRLAREHLDRAGARWTTSWVGATSPEDQIPFGPFVSLLTPTGSRFRDPSALMAHLLEAVARLGDRVLLGVDDFPLLDPSSQQLVRQLAMEGRVRTVATARTEGQAPPPLIPRAALVEVGAFDEATTATLLTSALDGRVHPLTLRQLWRWTKGNALHLRELVAAGTTDGRLTARTGTWLWEGPPAVPGDVEAVLLERIEELPPLEIEGLRLLSLVDGLPVSVLEELCGEWVPEHLEERGLVRALPARAEPQVGLVHPLYAECLRARMPSLTTRRLGRRLAAALAARPAATEADRIRVVRLLLEGGQAVAAEQLCEAAEAALTLFDGATALELIDLVGGTTIQTRIIRARALALLHRPEEAELVLSDIDAPALDPALRLEWATMRVENMVLGLLRPSDALDLAEDVLGELPAGLDTSTLRGLRLLALCYADRGEEALEDGGPSTGSTWLAPAVATSLHVLGRSAEALHLVDAALAAPDLPSLLRMGGIQVKGGILTDAGRYDELDEVTEELISWGIASGAPSMVGYGSVLQGIAAIYRGRFQRADEFLAHAASSARLQDPISALRWILAWRAAGSALAGTGGADSAMEECLQITRSTPQFLMMQGSDTVARSLYLAGTGNLTAARQLALHQAREMAGRGRPLWAVNQALIATTLGGEAEAVAAVRDVTPIPGSPLSAAALAHVRAQSARDVDALLCATDSWEALGAHWWAAEAAHAAAVLLERGGTTRSPAHRRFLELSSRCEDGSLPWRSLIARDGLTPREREIAHLAASGHSNREIADRLTLSVRTVENHLHAAYQKLGVSGREALDH